MPLRAVSMDEYQLSNHTDPMQENEEMLLSKSWSAESEKLALKTNYFQNKFFQKESTICNKTTSLPAK